MSAQGRSTREALPPALSRRALNRRLALLPLALAGCARSASRPGPKAPWHHTRGGFRNPPGSPERGGDFSNWMSFFWRNFRRADEVALPDGHVVPRAQARADLEREDHDSLTWLGHACFVLRLGGRTILTDPFLSEHASPLAPLGPKRFAPAGLSVDELPPIDVVLLSHNHYDHLDLPTLERVAGKARVQVITPLGLAHYATDFGYARVHEVDWGDRVDVGQMRITALPTIHFSKRTPFDRNRTLWTAYLIEAGGRRVHFAGDTAYGELYPRLGRELAPLDLGLVPIGAYAPRELMRAAHTTPEEAVRIGRDLGVRRLVGMHWGTIRLTDEPPFEPPGRFRDAARAAGYADDDAWLMAIGETRPI